MYELCDMMMSEMSDDEWEAVWVDAVSWAPTNITLPRLHSVACLTYTAWMRLKYMFVSLIVTIYSVKGDVWAVWYGWMLSAGGKGSVSGRSQLVADKRNITAVSLVLPNLYSMDEAEMCAW